MIKCTNIENEQEHYLWLEYQTTELPKSEQNVLEYFPQTLVID